MANLILDKRKTQKRLEVSERTVWRNGLQPGTAARIAHQASFIDLYSLSRNDMGTGA